MITLQKICRNVLFLPVSLRLLPFHWNTRNKVQITQLTNNRFGYTVKKNENDDAIAYLYVMKFDPFPLFDKVLRPYRDLQNTYSETCQNFSNSVSCTYRTLMGSIQSLAYIFTVYLILAGFSLQEIVGLIHLYSI